MFLYATLVLCAALAGLLVYRYDLYEREPWYMLVAMAAVGGVTMWVVGEAEAFTIDRLGVASFAGISFVAATHEEIARLFVVGLLALIVPGQLNDPLDGLIYGSIVGLGMAVLESINHMAYLPSMPSALPPSELVRLLGHLVLGGITCYGIGLARLRLQSWPRVVMGGLAFTITWHFLWDWIAFTSWTRGALVWWHNVAAVGLMLGGLFVYGVLVIVGSSHSREAFAPHDTRELWGWPFTIWRPTRS